VHVDLLEKLLTVSRSLPEGCIDEILHSVRILHYVVLVSAEPIVDRYDDEDARDPARDLETDVSLFPDISRVITERHTTDAISKVSAVKAPVLLM
jgi:hypothetical protein